MHHQDNNDDNDIDSYQSYIDCRDSQMYASHNLFSRAGYDEKFMCSTWVNDFKNNFRNKY